MGMENKKGGDDSMQDKCNKIAYLNLQCPLVNQKNKVKENKKGHERRRTIL